MYEGHLLLELLPQNFLLLPDLREQGRDRVALRRAGFLGPVMELGQPWAPLLQGQLLGMAALGHTPQIGLRRTSPQRQAASQARQTRKSPLPALEILSGLECGPVDLRGALHIVPG